MMSNDVTVCRLEKEWLAEVAELERLCFADPWSENALAILLEDNACGFICRAEGRVLAYGGMLIVPDEGQITNIAVHPDFRGLGYGRTVLAALTEEARARGLAQMSLEVRVSNLAALTLYGHSGFETAGVRKRFYKHPTEDAFVMLKML